MKNTFVKCVLLVLLLTTMKTFVWSQQRIEAIDFLYKEVKSFEDLDIAIVLFVAYAGFIYDSNLWDSPDFSDSKLGRNIIC